MREALRASLSEMNAVVTEKFMIWSKIRILAFGQLYTRHHVYKMLTKQLTLVYIQRVLIPKRLVIA